MASPGTAARSRVVPSVAGRTRAALLLVAVLAGAAPAGAQQTGLTTAQLKQAALETPRLVNLLGLEPGMSVADVGAGFGAWMSELARVVGPSGRVYATDVGSPQLEALRAWVARENLSNVTVIQGATDHTNLPVGCCDAVLIRDVYHHLTAHENVVASMAGALKSGGRLALIDFPPQAGSGLPAGVPANRGGHGVPAEVVIREVGAVLTHVRTIAPWAAPNQQQELYLLLFQKP